MTGTRTLGDIIKEHGGMVQTGPFGSQLHQRDYSTEGVPVVMPKDIRRGRIDEESVARVTEEKAQQLSRHTLRAGSIVFPRRGDISKCAYAEPGQEGFLCGTGCVKIEVPEHVLNSRFLFYYLGLRPVVQWLERNSVGTTMLNLNTSIIARIEIPQVPLAQQREIASILSPYDDLIENNRRRIQLLEQAARLLYEEWFVRFRFPGHEHVKTVNGLPGAWERKPLGKIAKLNYGKGLKADDRIPGPFPVYGSSGVVGTHNEALVQGPGIIVGRKGNVGSVWWSDCDFFPIDTVYFIDSACSSLYLYYALSRTQFISTDVAVPGLNRDLAHSREILVPEGKVLSLFEETVAPVHQQISKLQKYSESLEKARDLLLPRLMNGEIAV